MRPIRHIRNKRNKNNPYFTPENYLENFKNNLGTRMKRQKKNQLIYANFHIVQKLSIAAFLIGVLFTFTFILSKQNFKTTTTIKSEQINDSDIVLINTEIINTLTDTRITVEKDSNKEIDNFKQKKLDEITEDEIIDYIKGTEIEKLTAEL